MEPIELFLQLFVSPSLPPPSPGLFLTYSKTRTRGNNLWIKRNKTQVFYPLEFHPSQAELLKINTKLLQTAHPEGFGMHLLWLLSQLERIKALGVFTTQVNLSPLSTGRAWSSCIYGWALIYTLNTHSLGPIVTDPGVIGRSRSVTASCSTPNAHFFTLFRGCKPDSFALISRET